MTSQRLRQRDLPTVLDELAAGAGSDYLDGILAVTAETRQRPAWAFPSRWLPPVNRASAWVRPARAIYHSLPAGIVLAALLLVALLAAMLVAGRPRLPEPFGPARNGSIAVEIGGDIYTLDPATGTRTRVVVGPETDVGPRFSLDGTHIAFERQVGGQSRLFVVRSDGRDLRLVTPDPIAFSRFDIAGSWRKYQFSPDGRWLVASIVDRGIPSIALVATDGSGVRTLDVGMAASEPSFRPPDGKQLLFVGHEQSDGGLFVFDLATETIRTVLLAPRGFGIAGASWSPDGLRIAYWVWSNSTPGMSAWSHIVDPDGRRDQELPGTPGEVWNAHLTWSNDGTRLFAVRGYTGGNDDVRGFVLPADLSHSGKQFVPNGSAETSCCAAWTWSPDDTVLLGRPRGLRGDHVPYLVVNFVTGEIRPVAWTTSSDPAWQRLAP